jgi:hypothetical protein
MLLWVKPDPATACLQVVIKIGQNQVRGGGPAPAEFGRMDADSYEFSEDLSGCSRQVFRTRFARTARRLGLNNGLKREELNRLAEAAFLGALCNVALNGLGGCDGEIRPENEPVRRDLEGAYMNACHNFYLSPGWKKLRTAQKDSIRAVFLTVVVEEKNLAV